MLKKDAKKLRDAIRIFDSSTGCGGADICRARRPDGSLLRSNKRRLCEYAMQAIVAKISAAKDSALKPISKIDMSVENFLASAVCFVSRIEKEITIVSGEEHKFCTPFRSNLPGQDVLRQRTRRTWLAKNSNAFKMQARVSGLEKGGFKDDEENQGAGRKRSRDEFEAPASE